MKDNQKTKVDLTLNQTMGKRMKEARELNGLMLKEACVFFNKEVPWLSKIERGIIKIEVDTIITAHKIYDVSTDFICGLSEVWECDPVARANKSIELCLFRTQQTYLAQEINALTAISNKVATVEKEMKDLVPLIQQCIGKFYEIKHENSDTYQNLKKGTGLERAVERMSHGLQKLNIRLNRYHFENTSFIRQAPKEILPLLKLIGLE